MSASLDVGFASEFTALKLEFPQKLNLKFRNGNFFKKIRQTSCELILRSDPSSDQTSAVSLGHRIPAIQLF
jgi:hypothetical protein